MSNYIAVRDGDMNTWGFEYCGHVMVGIRSESCVLPLPYVEAEAMRLRMLGYEVAERNGNTIIIRPK
jgi:hypothetical protein